MVLDLTGDMEPTQARQAIALAIDRQAVLQIAGAGLGRRRGVLPPGLRYWALPWQELPTSSATCRAPGPCWPRPATWAAPP